MAGSRGDYSHIPIPSYEEAITSRPSSSQHFLGPSEVSHDAEREGLLGRQNDGGPSSSSSPFRSYRAPTVESARSSLDDIDGLVVDDGIGRGSGRQSMEELRREMSEMDFEDAPSRNKWSTRLSSLNLNLHLSIPSRFRAYLPSRSSLPSWSNVRASLPDTSFLKSFRCDFAVVIRIMAFVFVIFTGYLVFFSSAFSGRRPAAHTYDPESVKKYIIDNIKEGRMRTDLYTITNYDRLAGTEGSFVAGKKLETEWQHNRMGPVEDERFEVFLNYPTEGGRKVYISEPDDKRWSAKLEEDRVYADPKIQQTAVFHGHSKTANATGHLVYANYGSNDDFERLKDLGVKVEGAVVLMRQGGTQPDQGAKVKNAESFGAVGALLYADPADQDENMPAFGGQWRADGAVQRGAVSNQALYMGDVLSPGFGSTPWEKTRLPLDEAVELGYLPRIPSLPLAWHEDAEHLIKSLQGIGKHLDDASGFVGGIPYVEWWSGDESSPQVTIENSQDEVERQPIFNYFTRLEGAEQGLSKVVVGNHRDAWCFGAVDPGSGTAIMMEVSRIFSELAHMGWRPARTIEFASWDGGEFNSMGSTEHVESKVEDIRKHTFAYVNIGAGIFGPHLEARASPIMERVLFRVMDRIGPESEGVTLRKLWADRGSKLDGLGGGSDYVAFQNIAGVSSIDLGFSGSSYPKDTCFDEFGLMDKVFDPGFGRHKLLAQIVGLIVLDLADAPAVPLDFEAYANGIQNWANSLSAEAESDMGLPMDFSILNGAINTMLESARQHREYEDQWDTEVVQMAGYEPPPMKAERIEHNRRSMRFEKDLLDLAEDGGLPGRSQFKHVLFAPDKNRSDKIAYFPALREAIEAGSPGHSEDAYAQLAKIAGIIEKASANLIKTG